MDDYEISMKIICGQITELLTHCLSKAIDMAMRDTSGENWFAQFKAVELTEERPILKFQNTIFDCDLQALLKLLRYRTKQSEKVFAYFGYGISGTAGKQQKQQLMLLLDRLITDFRNSILAHPKAGLTIELRQVQIYDYEEAIRDMRKLAELFFSVTDSHGNSYYERMTKLIRQHDLEQARVAYPIDETLQKEDLPKLTERQFVSICRKLRITVQTVEKKLCFLSEDYPSDIEAIRNRCRTHRTRSLVRTGIITGGILVLAAACVLSWKLGEKNLLRQKQQAGEEAIALQEKENRAQTLLENIFSATAETAPKYIRQPKDSEQDLLSYLQEKRQAYDAFAVTSYEGEAGTHLLLLYDEAPNGRMEVLSLRIDDSHRQWKLTDLSPIASETGDFFRAAPEGGMESLLAPFWKTDESRVLDGMATILPLRYDQTQMVLRLNNGTDEEVGFCIDPATVLWQFSAKEEAIKRMNVISSSEGQDGTVWEYLKQAEDGTYSAQMETTFAPTAAYLPPHTAATIYLQEEACRPFSCDWSSVEINAQFDAAAIQLWWYLEQPEPEN